MEIYMSNTISVNIVDNSVFNAFYLLTGVLIFAISSKYQLPLFMVPMTMQTLVVLLMAWFYPERLGMYTLFCSYTLALCGLPILTSSIASGEWVMRIGYLAGFILATEAIYHMKKTKLPVAFIFAMAQCTILASGCTVLSQFFGWYNAWKIGVLPFILPELIKNILACAIVYTLQGPIQNRQDLVSIYSK